LRRSRLEMGRVKRKDEPETQPKRWRVGHWFVDHFAAGYVVAAVTLGALFLVTGTLGTVTNDDMAAVGNGNVQTFYFSEPMRTQASPVFFEISKTKEPRLLCGIVAETMAQTPAVNSVKIHISNRFGRRMQGVLNTLQWAIGLFYDIQFPTTLQTTVKEVLDPNFAQQVFDLQEQRDADLLKMQNAALRTPGCEDAVVSLLKENANALICLARWSLRSPDGEKILAVGVSTRCITLANDKARGFAVADYTPLLTKIKMKLGLLKIEVDRKPDQ
jgi:hypothetical protein